MDNIPLLDEILQFHVKFLYTICQHQKTKYHRAPNVTEANLFQLLLRFLTSPTGLFPASNMYKRNICGYKSLSN